MSWFTAFLIGISAGIFTIVLGRYSLKAKKMFWVLWFWFSSFMIMNIVGTIQERSLYSVYVSISYIFLFVGAYELWQALTIPNWKNISKKVKNHGQQI